MTISRVVGNLLKKLYFSTNEPTSFGNVRSLFNAAKSRHKKLKYSQVVEWLAQQRSWIAHKPVRRKFKRSKIYAPRPNYLWEADLAEMQNLAKQNDGVRYLLCVIDVFSKKAYVVPIKNKSADSVTKAMRLVLREGIPKNLRTDKGSEFRASTFQGLLKSKRINHYYAQGEMKAAVVERFNRTIKTRIARYLTENNTRRYVNVLDDFVSSYNNSVHRSIGMKPNQVNVKNTPIIHHRLYGNEQALTQKHTPRFKVGDSVFVARPRNPFVKGFRPTYKPPAWKIHRIVHHYPFRYYLSNKQGERFPRSVYETEMIAASNDVL